VRWHLCRPQNVFTVCDENAAEWPCVLKVLKQTFLFTSTVRHLALIRTKPPDVQPLERQVLELSTQWTNSEVTSDRHLPNHLRISNKNNVRTREHTNTRSWLVRCRSGPHRFTILAASVPYKFFNNGVTCGTSLTCTRTFPIVKEYKTCNTRFRKQTAFVFRWTNLQTVTMDKVLMHISEVNNLCSNYIKTSHCEKNLKTIFRTENM
jgi:hypothetical protein